MSDFKVPICQICGRERRLTGMDVYDYSPLQVISGQPLGWYSADDGEMCPEDITKIIKQ